MNNNEISLIIDRWGKEVVTKMITRIRNTENYSGEMRGITRLEDYFNPKLIADATKVMWNLELPEYAEGVDAGIEPGNKPSKSDIESWAMDRQLPEEGIGRDTFVHLTRNLVALRGVAGSNFFEVFDTMSGLLENELYNIGEEIIEQKITELQNKYNK